MWCFAESEHKYFSATFFSSQNITESQAIEGNHVIGAIEKNRFAKNIDADSSVWYLFIFRDRIHHKLREEQERGHWVQKERGDGTNDKGEKIKKNSECFWPDRLHIEAGTAVHRNKLLVLSPWKTNPTFFSFYFFLFLFLSYAGKGTFSLVCELGRDANKIFWTLYIILFSLSSVCCVYGSWLYEHTCECRLGTGDVGVAREAELSWLLNWKEPLAALPVLTWEDLLLTPAFLGFRRVFSGVGREGSCEASSLDNNEEIPPHFFAPHTAYPWSSSLHSVPLSYGHILWQLGDTLWLQS